MKLADYLLLTIYQNYKLRKYDKDFAEYLMQDCRLHNLDHYHMANNDALMARVSKAQEQVKKTELRGYFRHLIQDMFYFLGQNVRQAKHGQITEADEKLDTMYLAVTNGRNATYIVIKDAKTNQILAETSFKLSSGDIWTYNDLSKRWQKAEAIRDRHESQAFKHELSYFLKYRYQHAEEIKKYFLKGCHNESNTSL